MTTKTLEAALGAAHVVPGPALQLKEQLRQLARDLPRQAPNVPTALLVAQKAACFHCRGAMAIGVAVDRGPVRRRYSAPTRDHALPRSMLDPEYLSGSGAILMAHKLCNELRGQRPLAEAEWVRAIALWRDAHALWMEAGCTASPFPDWVMLAEHKIAQLQPAGPHEGNAP